MCFHLTFWFLLCRSRTSLWPRWHQGQHHDPRPWPHGDRTPVWHHWTPGYYLSQSQWRARQHPPQHGHQVSISILQMYWYLPMDDWLIILWKQIGQQVTLSFYFWFFYSADWDTRSKGFCVTVTQTRSLLPQWSIVWKSMKVTCNNTSTEVSVICVLNVNFLLKHIFFFVQGPSPF